MNWADLVNATLEMCGVVAVTLNCMAILRDKEVKGVHFPSIVFFSVWGFWNVYYYPSLGQYASFVAGALLCVVNSVYTGLLFYYLNKGKSVGNQKRKSGSGI